MRNDRMHIRAHIYIYLCVKYCFFFSFYRMKLKIVGTNALNYIKIMRIDENNSKRK